MICTYFDIIKLQDKFAEWKDSLLVLLPTNPPLRCLSMLCGRKNPVESGTPQEVALLTLRNVNLNLNLQRVMAHEGQC